MHSFLQRALTFTHRRHLLHSFLQFNHLARWFCTPWEQAITSHFVCFFKQFCQLMVQIRSYISTVFDIHSLNFQHQSYFTVFNDNNITINRWNVISKSNEDAIDKISLASSTITHRPPSYKVICTYLCQGREFLKTSSGNVARCRNECHH